MTEPPETNPASDDTPLLDSSHYARGFSILQRFKYNIILHSVQFIVTVSVQLGLIPWFPKTPIPPPIIKTYPNDPTLKHRLFIPPGHTPSSGPLPLYIDIHGGGFSWGFPVVDDPFCSTLCTTLNILVLALDYPKSPTHRFPAAITSLTNTVTSLLSDPTLPFSPSRVAIGGFSAGANLALAVAQAPALQGRFRGLVAFYPPANFAARIPGAAGPAGASTRWPLAALFSSSADPDRDVGVVLPRDQMNMFSWGYVPQGQDLRDPRLSPAFAERGRLPEKMFIVGCELDLLCAEAEKMALGMAGPRDDGDTQVEGNVWERNGIRWEKILGEDHAFDQRIAFGEVKVRMERRGAELYKSVAEWLSSEVYS